MLSLKTGDRSVIVYLDTSSLVKLYVEEDYSEQVAGIVHSSKVVATSLVSYAETRAAFARRYREKAFVPPEYKRLLSGFERDWHNFVTVQVFLALIQKAGDLAEKHALRGFDAIQLSSALILKIKLKSEIVFSCFDDKLQKASKQEGLDQPDF
ncbi:type II toxin-antitoxin system VapC family toxin [Acidobacteriota bacterium]